MLYKRLVRPLLFKLDAEKAHEITMGFLSSALFNNIMRPFLSLEDERLKVRVGNLTFRNPIGLAAGMDKDCSALESWDTIGFGFAEAGTVTPIPQEGNPKPRIFRLPEYRAIINRLGFNNCGADMFLKNLEEGKEDISPGFVAGVNIGKSKRTELADAFQDYRFCFEKLYQHADYFTINVSSPNTEGLRDLQQKKYLDEILKNLQELNSELDEIYSCGSKDIFLKIAPDLNEAELEDIIGVCIDNSVTGIIATNTTVNRDMLPAGVYESGGLSGRPLREASNAVLSFVKKEAGDKLHVIACGGIFTASDVREKLDLGASLVQLYTGLVYEGPWVVKRIKKEMLRSTE